MASKRPDEDAADAAAGAGDNDATQVRTRDPAPADRTMMVTESMVLPLGGDQTMALTPDMVVDATVMMAPDAVAGALAAVRAWHAAVNAGDADALAATCTDTVELVGPRGVSRGTAAVRDWLARAGFTAAPVRWFCGVDGHVVVEQRARWRYLDGAVDGVIASAFVVRGGRIAKYERFDELATALTMYGLRPVHEVTGRA